MAILAIAKILIKKKIAEKLAEKGGALGRGAALVSGGVSGLSKQVVSDASQKLDVVGRVKDKLTALTGTDVPDKKEKGTAKFGQVELE